MNHPLAIVAVSFFAFLIGVPVLLSRDSSSCGRASDGKRCSSGGWAGAR